MGDFAIEDYFVIAITDIRILDEGGDSDSGQLSRSPWRCEQSRNPIF